MSSPPSPLADLREAGRPNWAKVILRAAVTVGVLAALLALLPTGELLAALAALPFAVWIASLFGFGVGHVFAALKWRRLLQASGVDASVVESLRAHAAGLFANLCLPSIVGGDVLRAGLVIRRHGRAEAVALGSGVDRILDTLGLLVMAGFGALLIPEAVAEESRTVLWVIGAMLLAGVASIVGALMLLPRIPDDALPASLRAIASRLVDAARALSARPGVALACFALSIAIQTGFVALNARLGSAIGLALPFAAWLLAWPLAKLVALAPISLGGIGVREAALATLLLPFGVAPALAVAQSLVWETLLVCLGLLSGIGAFWLGGGHARSTLSEHQA